ncbi:MAG: hypothetical protein EA377_11920 [Phycisphaerales bacterium]|nr:MAG: hypothetical protein EA377_11920 [Phycisphaerales bacterium]
MHRRRETHPVIHTTALHVDAKVPVLHRVFLAGVDLAENLHHAENPLDDLRAERDRAQHVTVYPQSNGRLFGLRLDMNVRRASAECCQQDQAKDPQSLPAGILLTAQAGRLGIVHRLAAGIDQTDITLAERFLRRGINDLPQFLLVVGLDLNAVPLRIEVERLLAGLLSALAPEFILIVRRLPPLLTRSDLIRINEPEFDLSDSDHIAVIKRFVLDLLFVEPRTVA